MTKNAALTRHPVTEITLGSDAYPLRIRQRLRDDAPAELYALGNMDILKTPTLALLCSVRCPGSVILRTYDLAVALRERGITVVSGFHSPMEKECLRLLLRGSQPIIICPARGTGNLRLLREWQEPLASGRLLILSPFPDAQRRPTAAAASSRNQPLLALDDPHNTTLATLGARLVRPEDL